MKQIKNRPDIMTLELEGLEVPDVMDALTDRIETMQGLIAHGIDPDRNGDWRLEIHRLERIRIRLELGGKLNPDG